VHLPAVHAENEVGAGLDRGKRPVACVATQVQDALAAQRAAEQVDEAVEA